MDKPKNIFEFEDSGPKVVEPNHYLDDNRVNVVQVKEIDVSGDFKELVVKMPKKEKTKKIGQAQKKKIAKSISAEPITKYNPKYLREGLREKDTK